MLRLSTVLEQLTTPRGRELRSNRKICDIDREIAHIPERNLVLVRLKSKGYVDSALYLSQHDELERQPKDLRKLCRNILDTAGEDAQYLGTDEYPRLVSNEDFLAVSLIRNSKTSCAPCPSAVNPIRERAVCAVCFGRLSRNTRSHGRPRWVCENPDCGAIVHVSDDTILNQVQERLKQLASSPDLLTHPQAPKENASSEASRIQNEINLCFNRGEINPDYIKSLIFAAAAEEYAALPDSSPAHELTILRERLEEHSANEADLQELLAKAVTAIRIGGPDYIELELVSGQIIGKEQST